MTIFKHIMIRVRDLDRSYNFYTNILGFKEKYRKDSKDEKSMLVFLMDSNRNECIELSYDKTSDEEYTVGRSIGHISIKVSNIYNSLAQ